MSNFQMLDRIVAQFAALMEHHHELDIRKNYQLYHYIHLLIRDSHMGLDWNARFTCCQLDTFLQRAMDKYMDPADPTANTVKLKYYYYNCKEIKLEFLKDKYEKILEDRLQSRVRHLLQFPESSNAQMIDAIIKNVQVLVIDRCHLGSVTDHVLLNQVHRAMRRIVVPKDIKQFLLNRRYKRWDYLKRLCAIVAGVVLHSNSKPRGDKEHMRNVIGEVFNARAASRKILEEAIDQVTELITDAQDVSERSFILNGKEQKLIVVLPMEMARIMTAYYSLFCVHKQCLMDLYEIFMDVEHLIGVEEEKFRCAIIKIDEVLADRREILSDYIFPHFKHLSDVWSMMEFYIYVLAELNKVKEQTDKFVNEHLIKHFRALVTTFTARLKTQLKVEHTFEQLMQRPKKKNDQLNLQSVKDQMKQYCTLTLILTDGVLIPSHNEHKLCATSDIEYGFYDLEVFKYVAMWAKSFYPELRNTILGSVALVLLFNLESNVLRDYLGAAKHTPPRTRDFQCQYEWEPVNDLTYANRLNTTWNKWEIHRETILLANVRKCQTRSSQTIVTYGQRNAQNLAGLRSVLSGNDPSTRDAAT